MPVFTPTAALITMAAATAITAGATVHSGIEQRKAQKKGLKQQEQAQQQAMSEALSQRRQAAIESRKANQQSMQGLDAIVRAARSSSPRAKTDLTGGLGTNRLLGD